MDGRPAQASCYHLGLGRHVHLRYGSHTLDLPTRKGRSYTITLSQGKLVWR